MKQIKSNIIIIGAGAAGMMAAYFCAQKNQSVLLLDHAKKIGKRILISGGGKCNFTNMLGATADDYLCQNPHFVKSALSRYTSYDFLELIDKSKIPYEERLLGKLYCKRSARDIVELLISQLDHPKIDVRLEQKDLEVDLLEQGFRVFNKDYEYQSEKLIIATGGIVLPSIGASDFGHRLAKRVGHKIIPMQPALVPFKLEGWSTLAGNAFIVGLKCNGRYVEESVLFTHKGLSGPGVLKTSLFWNHGDSIEINWLPNTNLSKILLEASPQAQLKNVLSKYLPSAFVQLLLKKLLIETKSQIAQLSTQEIESIKSALHSMKVTPQGTEGFRKAEVTKGGICTSQISSKTMESKLRKDLYFIGEVLDVTGTLGGYNFQWCWSSAAAVAQAL